MSKVPCGGFELDESLASNNGKLGLAPGVGGVQADWNQNDDTQPDYVKNRPFYTGDPVETMLLEESTVSFTNVSSNIYYGKIPTTVELTAGKTYEVSWDGAAYECDCVLVSGFPAIGNQSIISVGADSGEPFLITPLSDNGGTEIYTLDTSASHRFSISEFAAAEADSDVAYIQEKGTLVVGITDFAPMDYKDESGQWIGFDADMARKVAEKLGVEVQFVEIDWDNKIMELNSKNIDVVWNGMTLTTEVTEAMECTNAYCNNAQVIVVPAE